MNCSFLSFSPTAVQQPSSSETMVKNEWMSVFYSAKIVVELKKVVKNRPTKRGVLCGGVTGGGGRARMLLSPCSSRSSGRDRQRALASTVSLIRRAEKVGRPTSTFSAVADAAIAAADEIDERGRSASQTPYSSGRARVRR